jgi:hypothetical protein
VLTAGRTTASKARARRGLGRPKATRRPSARWTPERPADHLAAGAERDQSPAAAGGGAAAFLRGPASFANVIPVPGTILPGPATVGGFRPCGSA